MANVRLLTVDKSSTQDISSLSVSILGDCSEDNTLSIGNEVLAGLAF